MHVDCQQMAFVIYSIVHWYQPIRNRVKVHVSIHDVIARCKPELYWSIFPNVEITYFYWLVFLPCASVSRFYYERLASLAKLFTGGSILELYFFVSKLPIFSFFEHANYVFKWFEVKQKQNILITCLDC